jgi:ubiquitin carboxyl-terminal hydrolase 5/13
MSSDHTEIKQLVEKYANEARVARPTDKVYKDECVYTHDTAESDTGLYICLATFISVSQTALPIHFAKSNSHLYLHMRAHRRALLIPKDTGSEEPVEKKRPTKLGIGIDGGFDLAEKQFYFENDYSLFVYPENKSAVLTGRVEDDSWVPERVRLSVRSVQEAESITQKEELACQAAAWDGEQRLVSKHSSTLTQLQNGVLISPDPASWKCDQCSVRTNLWLNLTDGAILCGRRQLDGSGGNNHAVEHYAKVKYPLAVKLGTITASGADVYSYDEDDMVIDSNLAVHLSHFGINMSKMQKTEKTMTELEIDLNQKVGEWDRIQESGKIHFVLCYAIIILFKKIGMIR